MKHKVIALLTAILLVCVSGYTVAEEETQPTREMTYEELLRYAEMLFGFEDTRYYPYLPTFLDPVNYFSYLSMHGGVKDDMYYVVYNDCDTERVASYLGYLRYWGYTGELVSCDLPGTRAWRMTSFESQSEGRPLIQAVDVYHVADHDLLVVAYSYLDAWIYDEWLARPDWRIYDHFEPGMLPCILPLNENVTITVEECFLTDLLFVTAGKELSLYPYDADVLEMRDLQITALNGTDASTVQYVLHVEPNHYNSGVQMMCIRVSCSYKVRDELLCSLRAALVEADEQQSQYADCTDVPMLLLTQSEYEDQVFSLAEEGENTDLWLVFPPGVFDPWEPYRLYFCQQDKQSPWIGDLRDWQYVNFQLLPEFFQ